MGIKHEDHWERFWGEDIPTLRHSFLADHYNHVKRIAKKLDIPWPERVSVPLSDEELVSWELMTLGNVLSQIEQRLGIQYRPHKPDVETEDGLKRWMMKSFCNRIKAIEEKLG
ncbi:TPA: hypothetical protein H1005_04430 [archaeon]|uniref:Uncharacterized protein n=1 Tax=Candidatus Naiadarchaeum limnaeum TaxID=2756139 RepID=A0A832XJN4_9ARCH|nr:hypothetical protein [Candidatus Naiadarchaeales archaeon SRR2090153.bin1042]HIK00847.1 hypothetical protein [Candidatus Naiadarchaeum limnaeum]